MNKKITLHSPDDWHVHLRDGVVLVETVNSTVRSFTRAIIMPNLCPPILNAKEALAYKQRILKNIPEASSFSPLMTLYLTDKTTPEIVREANARGDVKALKLYPAGVTTNSDFGVTDLRKLDKCLSTMAELDLPLLVHAEVNDPKIDIFDQEKVFIERYLINLTERFPSLKVVIEHITTIDAIEFIKNSNNNVAATITAHHLLYNRNDMLMGGIRPHYYCQPILKRYKHQQSLLKAATSGNPKFFLGTDSAPHVIDAKENTCGKAGCYTAPAAIEMYAEAFESMDALDKLEGFASHFGADFYGLPRNQDIITLSKEAWKLPEYITLDNDRIKIIPLRAGETLSWLLLT